MRRLLILATLLLASLPASSAAQLPPVQSVHRFTVPDSTHKLSSALPWASEYFPPPEYEQWWQEIAACQGLELPHFYRQVRFFQINAVHFYDADHPRYALKEDGTLRVVWAVAMSFLRLGEMWVGLPYLNEEAVIKHEMLHFLMAFDGSYDPKNPHPPERFERCGITTVY